MGITMDQAFGNNIVKMSGTVASSPELSHETYGEGFYKFYLETNRLSGQSDKLMVIISERLIDVGDLKKGKAIYVEGQYRSYNQLEENNKNRLILFVFVKEIQQLELCEAFKEINEITATGTICKKPTYRKTPLGRDIADISLAINRAYNKSDYIPCIIWGRNAKYCESLETGTVVQIVGRIQSRNYEKKYDNGKIENRVAYEVSISKLDVLKDDRK